MSKKYVIWMPNSLRKQITSSILRPKHPKGCNSHHWSDNSSLLNILKKPCYRIWVGLNKYLINVLFS